MDHNIHLLTKKELACINGGKKHSTWIKHITQFASGLLW